MGLQRASRGKGEETERSNLRVIGVRIEVPSDKHEGGGKKRDKVRERKSQR